MRIVVQRVSRAQVTVEGEIVGAIGAGLLLLVGIKDSDDSKAVDYLVEKVIHLRIFPDDAGKMNRSLLEVEGSVLVVSQFTLYGDCRKGRRPSFVGAASPAHAIPLYEELIAKLGAQGVGVQAGRFGAMMDVELVNNGPVTLIIDSLE